MTLHKSMYLRAFSDRESSAPVYPSKVSKKYEYLRKSEDQRWYQHFALMLQGSVRTHAVL